MDRVMTTDAAAQIITEIRAKLPSAEFGGRYADMGQYVYDGAQMIRIPAGHRTVDVIVRDARHGNTVIVTVEDGETVRDVARRLKAKVSERAKGTRQRRSVERDLNRS